ncbi:MICOS complex subunit MIC19 isoform X1 [Dromiciops gliroides]|uniref:MICOS complex subunit MIC19 isoform X1 n=1 Tax=Dromiciops gliroides TaxID=33562 RepID=UPI001CC4009D|nr:MICOS complex subunit MIC19 isoform X1 [Dromiciops gliroides]
MGGTSSTRRVTFEADENENITVVKGIRLSENVIGRMKESSPSGSKSPSTSRGYGSKANEEEIRRRVAEELALKESENLKRVKHGKIQAHEDINKLLEKERALTNEQLTRAILRERASSEEDKSKVKHLGEEGRPMCKEKLHWVAKQLEEKDRVLKKQDAFYKEQLARLEERSAEFYKVTTEQYQRAAEEVESKFKRYETHPICADLQAKILQCYRENPQQTLSCSTLANQYQHCVNHAKQSMLEKGG